MSISCRATFYWAHPNYFSVVGAVDNKFSRITNLRFFFAKKILFSFKIAAKGLFLIWMEKFLHFLKWKYEEILRKKNGEFIDSEFVKTCQEHISYKLKNWVSRFLEKNDKKSIKTWIGKVWICQKGEICYIPKKF